jgi:FAD/FMN-containing dehydrogenase
MTVTTQALDAVAGILGPRWVRRDRASLEAYAADGLPTLHALPGAVLLPGSRDELIRVLKVLAHHGVHSWHGASPASRAAPWRSAPSSSA